MNHDLTDIELEERAFLYVLGALPSDEALAFREHLRDGCETCAAKVAAQEELCAHLALTVPQVEPAADVREKLLARIAVEKQAQRAESAAQPNAPSGFLTVYANEESWEELTKNIFVKKLHVDRQKRTVTSLYKMLPGARVSAHKHKGVEECFVIEGDFQVDDLKLGSGDYHRAEAGSVHQTLYTEKGNLLLIISPEEGFETLNL